MPQTAHVVPVFSVLSSSAGRTSQTSSEDLEDQFVDLLESLLRSAVSDVLGSTVGMQPGLEIEPNHRGWSHADTSFGRWIADRGTHMDPEAPLPFSDFELRRKLGEGGMGVVFEAVQKSLGRRVAVKTLRGHPDSSDSARRFLREARAMSRLHHPCIVSVHGVGRTEDRGYFLVMDLIEGIDLQRTIDSGGVGIEKAAWIVGRVADAVQHAHESGIVHRDLKPSNVLLQRGKRPVLTDFGLAKHVGDLSRLSCSKAILGTAGYMAPEQADPARGRIGPWTDVYGLGGILYSLLVARPPFSGASLTDVLAQTLGTGSVVPPRELRSEVPRRLEEVCLRCLNKDPGFRYATAADLARALRKGIRGIPEPPPGSDGSVTPRRGRARKRSFGPPRRSPRRGRVPPSGRRLAM